MKIVLVDNLLLKNNEGLRNTHLQPHLGLISLIAVLEGSNYVATLYDPKLDIYEGKLQLDKYLYCNIADQILSQSPDIVGFTSLGCNFICTVKIAKYIKAKNPNIPILLGGPHATVLHKEIIGKFPQFDVIVRNESENKIVDIIKNLRSGKLDQIQGITFRKGEKIICTEGSSIIEDLETLPFPAYWAYPIETLSLKWIRVEAGRGCPFKCTFCSTATFFGRSYRLKSPKKICAELDYLRKQYDITDFSLTHDLFTVNRKKVIEFCNEIMDKKYGWTCSARMDCVDVELLKLMKAAGCRGIYYGVETGSTRMQEISMKKLNLDIFQSTLDTTLQLDILPTVSFIIGYPEEVKEDLDMTLDLVSSSLITNDKVVVQLHLLTPEPGTALLQSHMTNLLFDNYITDFNFPTLEQDDADLMSQHPEVFMNHHYFKTILNRSFYIATSSLFDTLNLLGRPFFKFLLKDFDNSFRILNDQVYSWLEETERPYAITFNTLLDFISSKFSSKGLHFCLAFYLKETFDLTTDAGKNQSKQARTVGNQNPYSVSPNIKIIPSTINCPIALEYLENNLDVPKRLLTKRINLVLMRCGNDGYQTTLRNFEIDNSTLQILNEINNITVADTTIIASLLEFGIINEESRESPVQQIDL